VVRLGFRRRGRPRQIRGYHARGDEEIADPLYFFSRPAGTASGFEYVDDVGGWFRRSPHVVDSDPAHLSRSPPRSSSLALGWRTRRVAWSSTAVSDRWMPQTSRRISRFILPGLPTKFLRLHPDSTLTQQIHPCLKVKRHRASRFSQRNAGPQTSLTGLQTWLLALRAAKVPTDVVTVFWCSSGARCPNRQRLPRAFHSLRRTSIAASHPRLREPAPPGDEESAAFFVLDNRGQPYRHLICAQAKRCPEVPGRRRSHEFGQEFLNAFPVSCGNSEEKKLSDQLPPSFQHVTALGFAMTTRPSRFNSKTPRPKARRIAAGAVSREAAR